MPLPTNALALGDGAAVTVTVKVREIPAKVAVAAWVAVMVVTPAATAEIVAPVIRAIAGLLDV